MADWKLDDFVEVIWIVGVLVVFVPVSFNEWVRNQIFRPSSTFGKTIFIAVIVAQLLLLLAYVATGGKSLLGLSLVGWGMLLLLGYFLARAVYLFWVARRNASLGQTPES